MKVIVSAQPVQVTDVAVVVTQAGSMPPVSRARVAALEASFADRGEGIAFAAV